MFSSGGAVSLAADQSWVYIGGATVDTVQRVRPNGTFLETLAAGVTSAEGGTFRGPLALAANCTSVFATELESPARIFAIPTGGAAPVTPVPLQALSTGGGYIAADAAYVYFTQPSDTYYVDLIRVPVSVPSVPQQVFALGTAETMRGALLLDDSYLFWLDRNGKVRQMASRRRAPPGCTRGVR